MSRCSILVFPASRPSALCSVIVMSGPRLMSAPMPSQPAAMSATIGRIQIKGNRRFLWSAGCGTFSSEVIGTRRIPNEPRIRNFPSRASSTKTTAPNASTPRPGSIVARLPSVTRAVSKAATKMSTDDQRLTSSISR